MTDVNPGDRLSISASDWNGMRRLVRTQGLGDGLERGAPLLAVPGTSPTTALAKNVSATAIARGEVVKVGAPLILPTVNAEEWWTRLAVEVQHPTTLPAGTWLGVARTPIGVGRIGRIGVAGVVPCTLNVISASHLYASANAGDTILRSVPAGPHTIVWRETGTGTKKALVHLGGAVQVAEVTAWLLSASLISGAANRWEYVWEEVELHATNGWQTKSGGLSSAGGEPKAWNGVEATNNGSGRESAGVDISTTATSSATLLAIGHGSTKPVYRLWREPVVGGTVGQYRWIFSAENEIDVACVE